MIHYKNYFYLLVATAILSVSVMATARNSRPDFESLPDESPLQGYYDGPYVLYDGDDAQIIRVFPGPEGHMIENKKMSTSQLSAYKLMVYPDGLDMNQNRLKPFEVNLFNFQTEKQWDYQQPEKIFAISDIECSFSNTEAILRAGGVIDEHYHWIYGENHLVVNGDMFSRGLDMMALLWLLYKLDQEALEAGGKVHITLGNHETMNLKGDVRYVMQRYLDFCEEINMNYKDLFGPESELGRWLHTKNTIVRIGRNLFVHGGISKEYLDWGLCPLRVNNIVRSNLGNQTEDLDEDARRIFGSTGPHWYRGMVLTTEDRNPVFAQDMPPILNSFGVDRFIVGHCKGDNVYKLRNRTVVAIDVNHTKNRNEGKARALQIIKSDYDIHLSRVNDLAEEEVIPEEL